MFRTTKLPEILANIDGADVMHSHKARGRARLKRILCMRFVSLEQRAAENDLFVASSCVLYGHVHSRQFTLHHAPPCTHAHGLFVCPQL